MSAPPADWSAPPYDCQCMGGACYVDEALPGQAFPDEMMVNENSGAGDRKWGFVRFDLPIGQRLHGLVSSVVWHIMASSNVPSPTSLMLELVLAPFDPAALTWNQAQLLPVDVGPGAPWANLTVAPNFVMGQYEILFPFRATPAGPYLVNIYGIRISPSMSAHPADSLWGNADPLIHLNWSVWKRG